MIPALIGFGLGWLARGLWEDRKARREALAEGGSIAEPEIPPAAAFARGPVTPGDPD